MAFLLFIYFGRLSLLGYRQGGVGMMLIQDVLTGHSAPFLCMFDPHSPFQLASVISNHDQN